MEQEKSGTGNDRSQGPIEKVIVIDICRDCKAHRSTTWHDENKYISNFTEVKAAIESITSGVQVIKKEGPVNLGAFEVKHGDKVLYSKKDSGLWPNPKAVAQRIKTYFEDLEGGRDVSSYGKQKEKAYVPPKKAQTDSKSTTSNLSKSTVTSKKLGSSQGFQAPHREDSAGGSPAEEYENQEDRIKHDEHDDHDEHEKAKHANAHDTRQAETHKRGSVTSDKSDSETKKAQEHQKTHAHESHQHAEEKNKVVEHKTEDKTHKVEEHKHEEKHEAGSTAAHPKPQTQEHADEKAKTEKEHHQNTDKPKEAEPTAVKKEDKSAQPEHHDAHDKPKESQPAAVNKDEKEGHKETQEKPKEGGSQVAQDKPKEKEEGKEPAATTAKANA